MNELAPLPQNNTARLWVDYSTPFFKHKILFRYPPSQGSTITMGIVADFFAALAPDLYAITVDGARLSATGSNISTPVAWTGAAGYGTGALPPETEPLECRFEGRSPTGRRVNWSFYATKLGVGSDYRIPVFSQTSLANAYTVLANAVNANALLAIDGFVPVIYPYVNIQYNSYWERQMRG